MTFSERCVNKPVTTVLVFVLTIVLGIFCTTQLPVDMYPDMDLPYMLVYTAYDGAGPEEVEQSLTSPLESSLSGLSGLKQLQSRSMGGISLVILEFNYGVNLDAAGGDVRDKIDLVRNFLPDSADSPITIKLDPSMMPILSLALKGSQTPEELRILAEDVIQPRLEQVDGIASANVSGGREKSINVDIPRDRLEAYGLTISSVAQMIGVQNIQSSGGTITSGDMNYTIKNDGKYKSLEDLKNTVISYKAGNDGLRTVRLRDIADVYEGYKDVSTLAYLDGEPCVMLMLQKQSGKNSVQSAKNVRKVIHKLKSELPSDVEIIETSNTVDIISQTISEVVGSVIQGALLAIMVLFIFLRSMKSTLIVGASIPISVMITLLCMYLRGITINQISMAGMLLGIGMLVDNSIVVLENIYAYIERDTKPKVAAVLGSQEMVSSIVGSTLTSVCIFLPMLVFKSKIGMMGQLFNDFAYTIIFSLMSSLVVAVALVPVLCASLVKKAKVTNRSGLTYAVNRAFNHFFDKLDEKYAVGVAFVLHHRKTCIASLIGLFICSIVAVKFIGFVFMPPTVSNFVEVNFKLAQGTKVEVTEDTLREFETMALEDLTGVKYSTVTVGGTSMLSSSSETNTGSVKFTLYEPKEREKGFDNETTAKEKLRKYFSMFPGASLSFAASANSASSSSGVSIDIKSDDLNLVMKTAKDVEKILKEKATDLVSEVETDLQEGLPQANIVFDRDRMQEFGLNIYAVGNEIGNVINGATASRYTKNGDDIDVVVRVSEKDRARLSDLDSISMVTSSGVRIPLSSFAHYEESTSPVTIYREDQARIIHVTAKPLPGISIGKVQPQIIKLIEENVLKEEGVTIGYTGDMEEMKEAVTNFGMIIILAAFLVFVVMASQFESLLDPYIVILTIPLSFIGVVAIYGLTGTMLNVVTIIGMLVLVGTIVNNGIVLVDYTNLLRKRGFELEEACIQAARNRLRPILMSTLTTVISLAPMAFFPGEGSASMQPISLTTFGGMTFGSIMTLFLMPTIYFIFNNRRIKKAEKKAIKAQKKAEKIAAKEKAGEEKKLVAAAKNKTESENNGDLPSEDSKGDE